MSVEAVEESMSRFMWFIGKSGIDFKQHQYDGVEWCVKNELSQDLPCAINGGFIADEMGLGKTLLMIGLMISNLLPKTLIVLPNILIEQWTREIERTTGHCPLLVYGQEKKNITKEQFDNALIVITSYGTLVSHKNTTQIMLDQKWSRIVFDEAHHLRNGKKRYEVAKQLKSQCRWLVSGTPIQNRLKDFYNLCSSLNLPPEFYKKQANLELIANHFILRRTKKQVGLLLADPVLTVKTVEWTYNKEYELARQIHEKMGQTTSKTTKIDGKSGENKLQMILSARKMCILPKMVKPLLEKGEENVDDIGSSKMDSVLRTLIERSGNGNGKLIFCHFHQEMDTIVSRLLENGITSIATIDGRIASNCRQEILETKHEYILLQIQVGCEGLNLQADFSEIYFISPHWNPATEEQAIARCHRIGQQKQVHVFRFIMATIVEGTHCDNGLDEDDVSGITDCSYSSLDSIEEKIVLMQQKKREIGSQIFR